MTTTYISSQRYLNDEIVEAKRAAKDYTVTVGYRFEIDGREVAVVVDGHHALAAAKADGVAPVIVVNEIHAALLETSVEDYIAAKWVDSDWYDIATGRTIF